MFSNVFYFIIVFSLLSFYEPRGSAALFPHELLFCLAAAYGLFFAFAKIKFARLEKKYIRGNNEPKAFSTGHGNAVTSCTVLAIALYGMLIYVCDIKYFIAGIAFLKNISFAQNILGLAPFFAFLIILWACAFPSYQRFYNAAASMNGYIASHLRLNLSLVVPWVIFSLIMDLIELLSPGLAEILNNNSPANYVLLSIVFVILGGLFPWLLVKIWNCRPMPEGLLRQRLQGFCRQSGFTCADILVWDLFDGKLITAGVLGFVNKFRYLLISPALLDMLNEDELESVLAHEIGHVKSRHMIFYLVFVLGYMLFAYVFFTGFYFTMLSQDFFFNLFVASDGKFNQQFSILSMILLVSFLLLYFRFLFGLFSRNFERQSDGYSIKLKGSGAGIISSLEKIALAGSQSRAAPNWHHFSIQQRVDYLRRCEVNPGLVRKHDKKVSGMVAAYLAALVALGSFCFGLNSSVMSQSEMNLLQKMAEKKIEAEPANPMLHFLLANIYYEKKLFEKAEKEYLITISLKPQETEALNNLAWLYATAEDEKFRKPGAALRFSLIAAELDPRPHILDTLAESYFINGYAKEAVEAITRAIEKNPPNMTYFQAQLKKFEEALQMPKGNDSAEPEKEMLSI